jgi:hypothetical protein
VVREGARPPEYGGAAGDTKPRAERDRASRSSEFSALPRNSNDLGLRKVRGYSEDAPRAPLEFAAVAGENAIGNPLNRDLKLTAGALGCSLHGVSLLALAARSNIERRSVKCSTASSPFCCSARTGTGLGRLDSSAVDAERSRAASLHAQILPS